MNTALTFLSLAATVMVALGDTPPLPTTAQVTMPYGELRGMLAEIESLRAAERERAESLPVPFAVHRIGFSITEAEGRAVCALDAEVENFTGGWQLVPLVKSSALRLDSAETGTARVIGMADGFSLRVPPESVAHPTLRFVLGPDAPDAFALDFEPAGIARLRIADSLPLAAHGEPLLGKADGQRVYAIASHVELRREDGAGVPDLPSVWQGDAEIAVRLDDGRLAFDGLIRLQAEQGDGARTVLALPRHARIVAATSEGLSRWSSRNGTDAATREVVIDWDADGSLHRDLHLQWQMPRPPLGDPWSLASPQIIPPTGDPAPSAVPALFAVEAIAGVEFSDAGGARLSSLQSLPASLREKIPTNDAATISSGGPPVLVQATWLPREKIAEAMIESAEISQRLVADGALLTTAVYTVGHREGVTWALEIPAGAQILSCTLDNQTAQPVRRTPDGPIEFVLPSLAEPGKSEISLCYAGKLEKLDPVAGSATLSLPRTDLFIHRLRWTLEMPSRYETTAAEGNIEIEPAAPSAAADEMTLRFHKDLCRGETPTLEIYYRRLN